MRRAVVTALVLTALCTATALAGPPLTITGLRVTTADGRTPAMQPLFRGRAYRYRLDYRVGGRRQATVTRRATFVSPYGDILQQIQPPVAPADPGRLFASGPLRVATADSPGQYVLRYSVTATNRTGSTTRDAVLTVRFR